MGNNALKDERRATTEVSEETAALAINGSRRKSPLNEEMQTSLSATRNPHY